jgi:hypothetical protein
VSTPTIPFPPGQPGPMDPKEFKSASVPSLVTFAVDGLAPPSDLYIGRDDVLLIQAITNSATDTVTVNLRLLTAQTPESLGGQPGVPSPILDTGRKLTAINFAAFQIPLTANNLVAQVIPLTEGFLLSVAAAAVNAGGRGNTFVRATLIRASLSNKQSTLLLFSDYVYQSFSAGWPGGRILATRDGVGFLQHILVANPGAGVEWQFTPPAGSVFNVRSFLALFTASAAVANRFPSVRQNDQGSNVGQYTSNTIITASQVITVSGTNGSVQPQQAADTRAMIPLPSPCWVSSNASGLLSSTLNLQAGDTWTAISVYGELYVLLDG